MLNLANQQLMTVDDKRWMVNLPNAADNPLQKNTGLCITVVVILLVLGGDGGIAIIHDLFTMRETLS